MDIEKGLEYLTTGSEILCKKIAMDSYVLLSDILSFCVKSKHLSAPKWIWCRPLQIQLNKLCFHVKNEAKYQTNIYMYEYFYIYIKHVEMHVFSF